MITHDFKFYQDLLKNVKGEYLCGCTEFDDMVHAIKIDDYKLSRFTTMFIFPELMLQLFYVRKLISTLIDRKN